jgi:hypothetical protein
MVLDRFRLTSRALWMQRRHLMHEKLGLWRELTQRPSAKRADRSNAAFAGAKRAGASPFFPDVRANF